MKTEKEIKRKIKELRTDEHGNLKFSIARTNPRKAGWIRVLEWGVR